MIFERLNRRMQLVLLKVEMLNKVLDFYVVSIVEFSIVSGQKF